MQPPEKDADVGNVVASASAGDPPHVNRVGQVCAAVAQVLESAGKVFQPFSAADAYEALILRPQVIQVLTGGQQLEEFNRAGGPAGHVAGQLLEHGSGSFATAIPDGVPDLRSWI